MSNDKKFSCVSCGTKVPFGYALTISDGKRYVCKKCGAHLVPATHNVIYRRVAAVMLTFLYTLGAGFFLFSYLNVPRTFIYQLLLLLSIVGFYFLTIYILVYRAVFMKKFED